MLQQSSRDESIIGCLRIVSAREDSLVTQLRLASLLSAARLHPAGLPSSAVVFIRKVRDPMPGVLRTDQNASYLSAAWERSVRESIGRIASNARRPAVESVPPDAESVIFLDQSELLASMAGDWCAGRITLLWWWKRFLRHSDPSLIVKQLWHDTPEYVPAALQQLAGRNRAVEFVSKLTDDEAKHLLRSVVRSFALNALTSLVADETGERETMLLDQMEIEDRPALPATMPIAPWHRSVPEGHTAWLRPEQQLFLGVALMIQREPSRVRAPSFAREVRQWQRLVMLPAATKHKPQPETETDRLPRTIQQPRALAQFHETPKASPAEHLSRDVPASQPTELATNSQPVQENQYESRATALADLGEEKTTTSPSAPAMLLPTASAQSELSDIGTGDTDLPRPRRSVPIADLKDPRQSASLEFESPARFSDGIDPVKSADLPGNQPQQQEVSTAHEGESEAATGAESELLSAIEIETEFGGLFYLISLALYLELYRDFTNPSEPGIELSVWDFVALVGTELLGENVQEDPIWWLLATLGGREKDERPGRDFEPPDEWRLPAEWLKPFTTERPGHWATHSGRLRLAHPDGFLVLDLPLESDNPSGHFQQLLREIEPYQNLLADVLTLQSTDSLGFEKELENQSAKGETSEALGIWLSWLMPYVKVRLCRALGLGLREDPAPILCRRHGRVRVNPTHVDVFFVLSELPVEIRLAGLDRDPGWVPSAGRFIAFHYD